MKNDYLEVFSGGRLPQEIIFLLSQNFNSSFGSYNGFERYLDIFPLLSYKLKRICYDIDPEGQNSVLFKSLGWKGLLERILTIFYGTAITDLITKADALYLPFAVEGYYRHWFPFLYALTGKNHTEYTELVEFLTNRETLNYFKILRKRNNKIDYILMMLFLFEKSFGRSKMLELLRKKEYHELYFSLKVDDLKFFLESILNYSYVIDDHLFFEDIV